MNNIDEMIAVLEAYKRGEKIECFTRIHNDWRPVDEPSWNFGNVNYRIAKPAPKKVKLEAWFIGGELRWLSENHQILKFASDPIRVPAEDKEIELP